MLAIRVEYLTGVCMATRHDDPSRSMPEWPPHPDRLFSALVAGAAGLLASSKGPWGAAVNALEWLLNQGPPQVAATEAYSRRAPDVHMPTNPHDDEVWQTTRRGGARAPQASFDLRMLLPVYRKRVPLPIPAVIPEMPVVHFIWKSADASDYLKTLRAICDCVTYLGRSRSPVLASVVDNPPPPRFIPDSRGEIQLRVPGPGRLSYLMEKYRRDGGKPAPCPPHRYRVAEKAALRTKPLASVFERCWIFRPRPGDPPLPSVSTVRVTQALRQALIACIEQDQRMRGVEIRVPDVVHGHGARPHCAFVALPFVHPHRHYADGSIKGVAVLLPYGVDPGDLLTLARGLARLEENGLGIPARGSWHLREATSDSPPNATLDERTWTSPAQLWTTATPMVFGHYPKRRNGGEAEVVLKSLKMMGIEQERVLEVAVGRHSPLHGAPPTWCFKAPGLGGGTRAPLWIRHVTVRFDRLVRGPLVLGRMRHFGLGLMRPLGL